MKLSLKLSLLQQTFEFERRELLDSNRKKWEEAIQAHNTKEVTSPPGTEKLPGPELLSGSEKDKCVWRHLAPSDRGAVFRLLCWGIICA